MGWNDRSLDDVGTFLRSLDRYSRVLSAEEEIQLTRRIQRGVSMMLAIDIFNRHLDEPPPLLWFYANWRLAIALPPVLLEFLIAIAQELTDRYQEVQQKLEPLIEGDKFAAFYLWALEQEWLSDEDRFILRDSMEAIDTLCKHNLRLSFNWAKKAWERTKYKPRSLDLLDLLNETCFGLRRAAEKFDYEKGYKFSTYAVVWINQSLGRGAASKAYTIALPSHVQQCDTKIDQAIEKLQKQGRSITLKNLSEVSKIPESKIEMILPIRSLLSLSYPMTDDGSTLLDTIGYESEAEQAIDNDIMKERIREAIETLPTHYRNVIEMRYGFGGYPAMRVEEIACRLGVSRTRIRQRQKRGEQKLRERLVRSGVRASDLTDVWG